MATMPAVGPADVSQLSASVLELAVSTAPVTFRVAFTVRGVPVAGVKVITTTWPLVAPAQPAAMLKLKFTAVVAEPTDCADGAAASGLPKGNEGVTITAAPAVASLIPTELEVGEPPAAQVSVNGVDGPTNVAVAWRVPVEMDRPSTASRILDKCSRNIRLYLSFVYPSFVLGFAHSYRTVFSKFKVERNK